MERTGQEILDKLLESIKEDLEEQKVPIATVSEELRKKYLLWREKDQDLEDRLEMKMKLLKSKLESQLAEEFEEEFLLNKLQKKHIWNEIRKEINHYDKDINLNLDPKTGVISEWVTTNEPRD